MLMAFHIVYSNLINKILASYYITAELIRFIELTVCYIIEINLNVEFYFNQIRKIQDTSRHQNIQESTCPH
jgi:hypothetical protein